MTNTDGLTFPQWLDQVDKLLHHHIKMNHADFDCDYEWQAPYARKFQTHME